MPMKPKVPVGKVKTPDQIKAEAQRRAKARMKRMIRVLVIAGIFLVVGLVVYFVKFYGRMPKDAFNTCVKYAYQDNMLSFRDCFTSDSIAMIESSDGSHERDWEHLIDEITPSKKPEVKQEEIATQNNLRTAELSVMIDGVERSIFMREEEGRWKINLNVAINPRKITLPDDIPAEYIDGFETSDEPEAWWEEGEQEAEEKKKGGGGFFAKMKRKIFRR